MEQFKTQVKRSPDREEKSQERIKEIRNEAWVAHVGFVDEGLPYVIPMFYVLFKDHIILHGSKASRMMNLLKRGTPVCATVCLEDGLVYAKAAFSHSMNYRSVMVMGSAELIKGKEEKQEASQAVVEALCKNRWQEVRQPSEAELAATLFFKISLEKAVAKTREGHPTEKPEDADTKVWTGIVPMVQKHLEAITQPGCDLPVPQGLQWIKDRP